MTFTSPFDEHEDDHRHGSLPWKDTKDALTKVSAGDPITGDGTAANPLGLSLSVNAPITGDGTAANPLDVPTLCEEAATLAIVAHGSGHRVIAFSATTGLPIPPTYIGYDGDVAGRSWSTILADYYVWAFYIDGVYTPSAVGIWGGDAVAVQAFLDTALVASGYTSGAVIWAADPTAGTITLWADPSFPILTQSALIFAGDLTATQEEYTPSIIVTTPPPPTSGSCVLIQVDASGTVTTAPLTIAGVTYNAQTPVQAILAALVAAPELWESVAVPGAVGGATQTRLIANPTKVIVDDVLGNVGINVAPTQHDLSVGGEMIIYPSATAAPNIRLKSAGGSIVSNVELIDAVTTVTTAPYLAIDLGPVQAVALAWTIDYRVRRGATTAKQVGGQIYLLVTAAGVISRLDASSYGADLIDEVVAGIDPANNHVMLFLNAKSTLAWEFSVYARTEGMEAAGVPVRWTWSQIASLPAYATFVGDIRNTFWQNLTKGRLAHSRITNGVAQNEMRVWDINGLVTVANSWAEINTHYIPAVDGGAALGVEIRQRAGTAAGTASGQLSFSVTAAGVFSNVAWESHGGRLPTNVGVGLNAAGEVVILYRDTGPTGGYAIHTEVYGHTVTHKKLWDLTTLAADPSAGYTAFFNAVAAPVSAPQLWTDNGTNLFPTLTSQNSSVVISDVTGNVGIGGAPSLAFKEITYGNRWLETPGGVDVVKYGQNGVGAEILLGGASYSNTSRFIELATQILSPAGTVHMMVEIEAGGLGGNTMPTIHYKLWLRTVSGVAVAGKATNTGSMAGIKSYFSHTATGINVCFELPAGLAIFGERIKLRVLTTNLTTPELWTVTAFNAIPAWTATSTVTVSNAEIDLGIATATTLTATGTVTASAFIIASDPIIKDNITDLHPDIATKILSTLSVGTWEYNNVMGKGEPSAGITDATKLREMLPAEMQDAFTPIKQHALDETKPDELTDVTYVNQQLITAVLWRQLQTDMEAIATANKKLDETAAALATTQKDLADARTGLVTANKRIATLEKQVTDVLARLTKAGI